MPTVWRLLVTPRSLLALGIGLLIFIGLSLYRVHLQYSLHPAPALGLALTVLMYVIPGAIVGLLATQHRMLHGAVLGLLTVGVVWFEVPLGSVPVSWLDIAEFVALMTLFGVSVSAAASGIGYWSLRRVTSNNRWSGP